MAKAAPVSIINLGSIDAIPLGQGRCYIVGSEEVAIFRQRDGRLFATENRCPHRQGPLAEGLLGDGKIICPMHSHQFKLENGGGSEALECVQVYGVEEVGGNILLQGG